MTEKVARLAVVDIPNKKFTYALSDHYRYTARGDNWVTEYVNVFTGDDGVTKVVSEHGHEVIFSNEVISHSKAVGNLGYFWTVDKKFLADASNKTLLVCLEEFDETNDWAILLPFFMEAEDRLSKWGWET